MNELRFTLLADGSSDSALIPLLKWLLRAKGVSCGITGTWADYSRTHNPPKKLPRRIELALYAYPCDLLFIHRDAEGQKFEDRRMEIRAAYSSLKPTGKEPTPAIPVIPIRMTEAWLLFNETAIRRAAGNPNGNVHLSLPPTHHLEQETDPKNVLTELIRTASELSGRRLRRFEVRGPAHRVAQ